MWSVTILVLQKGLAEAAVYRHEELTVTERRMTYDFEYGIYG
jgi:hypothetical protein